MQCLYTLPDSDSTDTMPRTWIGLFGKDKFADYRDDLETLKSMGSFNSLLVVGKIGHCIILALAGLLRR